MSAFGMTGYLRITVRFLDPQFHGRREGGEPEWPPSPLRLFQALVAANAGHFGSDSSLEKSLSWLETQGPPLIVAPRYENAAPYCLSVPNNAMDVVGRAWSKGNYFGGGDLSPATHKSMKMVRPVRIIGSDEVHYLWALGRAETGERMLLARLIQAARRIVRLGWGIDLVAGHADRISAAEAEALKGELWLPEESVGLVALRTPIAGTLSALRERHAAFLNRISEEGFVPVGPLTRFKTTEYRRRTDPVGPPHAAFELGRNDGSLSSYPQRKLIHVAGMVRHLAIRLLGSSPPEGVGRDWAERYVAGHRAGGTEPHRQFSYLPLPSIGHEHSDQAVRRVMVAAPVGDDAWLQHLARLLQGRMLEPKVGDEFGDEGPPSLSRVRGGPVIGCYTRPASRWASVTPVILPGHDDRKPVKTRKLVAKALSLSGIEVPCQFEWSTSSVFRRSLPSHKFDRNGKPIYLKPRYLQGLTAIHLKLAFEQEVEVPGPLAIGAGRHLGFGLMAAKAR